MKLVRYGDPGREKPGCLDKAGCLRDLSHLISDIAGDALSPAKLAELSKLETESLPLVENQPRLGPCVHQVGKFLCIGLNYEDHAKETGVENPSEPVVFLKATSAITGPYDPIVIPHGSTHTDWEVELGVVIGKRAKHVPLGKAGDYIAGYCVINDVSERHFQKHNTSQWAKGKSCDTFGPIGPWLVTSDEIADPQQLSLWLEVDGKRYQDGHTSKMIFDVKHLVSYLSRFFTLYPGDIISTGTPAGVGYAQKPEAIYLKPGQTVRLGITGLGEQKHKTTAEDILPR
ncbi:fumarylacetoacetate hydrolase family protein [Aquicella lusitana]|uniref:2-keto-4-pentenoate hydratase/2-oxohepta-3-ene-1,7-dioic acid hydratase in catechol pathway n=1 Tax=Aquicella lusitana TaxID=254246 RepID=A0A370GJ57_9COXI|nr:fumarylacetoacetate hydrolase family protein [Aquicella lusitana]RDI43775.1 2-keto-4-pentenoate hydratase/2-oxohepta-3-ene-1,7-dioic acid hydratase in catechol pathway [Aquicella lusitana]VVC74494.1 Ureidoglycolate lyase [Aquicella lusitana]